MDAETKQPRSKKRKLLWIILPCAVVVLIALAVILTYWHNQENKPPSSALSSAARQLGFDVYYPVQKLLPSGYKFNIGSISYSNQTIVFSVSISNNTRLNFSEQRKPSSNNISSFYTAHMPLYTTKSTAIGSAAIGAIGSQTIVSLPTNTNTWILITTPTNVNQAELTQVLNSLKVSN